MSTGPIMSTAANPTGPLAGVRVFDLTSVIMGPLATQILGDQGADVITVERHGTATSRVMGAGPHPDLSGVALNLLRNKRNIVVDLGRPAGRDIALRLAATCDVFVTNLRPGPLARLGLGYADVAAVRPDVVYCRATGFPSDSPRAAEPAYDDIIQAASGMADTMRLVNGEPSFLPTLVADKVTGLLIAQAISAALFHRERSGRGQEIEIPMIDASTAFTLVEHGAGAIPAEAPVAAGYPRILSTHRRPHPTKDGWVAILPYSLEHYEQFFAATGLLDEVDPEMYADGRTRIARSDVLYGYVRRATPQRTTAEWLELCRELHIPASAVATLDELVGDLPVAEHPVGGPYRVIPSPARFGSTPAGLHRHAALPGGDTREILDELGLAGAEVEALLADGTVDEP
jgi:crotonobetainyl-CoA:carnitine CoA-transferase CaiB-like acyl-CoA transferase